MATFASDWFCSSQLISDSIDPFELLSTCVSGSKTAYAVFSISAKLWIMEPRNFKKLAPAPASPSSVETSSQTPISIPGPRRNLTRNACSPCKLKKAKCDGNRPLCGRCQKAGDTCLYEANKRDIGRLQLLSESDASRLQNFEVVFGILQNGNDYEAAHLFSQIRAGESIETLAPALTTSLFQPSASTPSNQVTLISGQATATTHDGSEDPSSTVGSESFMDLLFDQNGWAQPDDGIDGYDSQIAQGGSHGHVPDTTHTDGQKTQF
ncbi:hypothetical protein F5Y00DRAFT_265796 [Daldinia vernicosa]|uniref:uncharacterized protein n=1 Tax=Daldinia vernicosa TaxID=114800 RepID=UPI002008B524|nr:uncharacterized protein F5Y00DRAFT_265796 [Daldinia vernicosa]KAI0845265.1 hypothetical protein F5Y00DRAFT_265796 [Daldinia vernicosa]